MVGWDLDGLHQLNVSNNRSIIDHFLIEHANKFATKLIFDAGRDLRFHGCCVDSEADFEEF